MTILKLNAILVKIDHYAWECSSATNGIKEKANFVGYNIIKKLKRQFYCYELNKEEKDNNSLWYLDNSVNNNQGQTFYEVRLFMRPDRQSPYGST